MNLYELAEDYKFFEERYNAAETLEEEEDALNQLHRAEDDLVNKADNIVAYIKNLDGEIDKFKTEENRLKQKRQSLQNKQNGLKNYLESAMLSIGAERIKTNRFNVRIQNNSVYSMDIIDEEKIPKEYFVEQEPKLDAKRLKDEITKNGLYIEGVNVYKGKHLRIN